MASQNATQAPTQSLRRRLGRGLGSLISTPVQVEISPPVSNVALEAKPTGGGASIHKKPVSPVATQSGGEQGTEAELAALGIRMLLISEIRPNPRQPRQHFDEAALKLLADSITSSGLMQPIVVRREQSSAAGTPAAMGGYQIIAGERRWRAAQLAGLTTIPAVLRTVDDRTAAELSLVENLQREDLNPMERADAFRRLIDDYGLTHQEIARQVGLDRTSVTNHLRLLELDDATKEAVRAGRLSTGHAKALLSITNLSERGALAQQALRQGWSVRELERRARAGATGSTTAEPAPARLLHGAAAQTADLQRRLSEHLGTKVRLLPGRNKGSGRLIIDFYSLDQFEGLMKRIQFDAD